MSLTMIENVERAIYQSQRQEGARLRDAAIAVLTAMFNPTDVMIIMGEQEASIRESWNAMIAAALWEKPDDLATEVLADNRDGLDCDIDRLKRTADGPHLGLATNEQLINELRARIEVHFPGGLNYRTVDDQ